MAISEGRTAPKRRVVAPGGIIIVGFDNIPDMRNAAKPQHNTKDPMTKYLVGFIILILFLVFLNPLIVMCIQLLNAKLFGVEFANLGMVGDSYGFSNMAVSGAAFVAFLVAIRYQRKDLVIQKNMLEQQLIEMKGGREQALAGISAQRSLAKLEKYNFVSKNTLQAIDRVNGKLGLSANALINMRHSWSSERHHVDSIYKLLTSKPGGTDPDLKILLEMWINIIIGVKKRYIDRAAFYRATSSAHEAMSDIVDYIFIPAPSSKGNIDIDKYYDWLVYDYFQHTDLASYLKAEKYHLNYKYLNQEDTSFGTWHFSDTEFTEPQEE